jgi:hypothetical protein
LPYDADRGIVFLSPARVWAIGDRERTRSRLTAKDASMVTSKQLKEKADRLLQAVRLNMGPTQRRNLEASARELMARANALDTRPVGSEK